MPAPSTTPAPPPPPHPWALHRRLYNWMLSFSHSPWATVALCLFSIAEAIFFPIPPFVLQIPMTLERRSRAWFYAGITTASSVLGGLGGYAIGASFHGVAVWLFGEQRLHDLDRFTASPWILTAGAIAIHPYKLYTIASGFLAVPLGSFLLASIIGRATLFFGIGALLWFFGPPVRAFIDRYFNALTIAFGVLLAAIIIGAKVL